MPRAYESVDAALILNHEKRNYTLDGGRRGSHLMPLSNADFGEPYWPSNPILQNARDFVTQKQTPVSR